MRGGQAPSSSAVPVSGLVLVRPQEVRLWQVQVRVRVRVQVQVSALRVVAQMVQVAQQK